MNKKRLFILLCCVTMLAACSNEGKKESKNEIANEIATTSKISNKISGDLSFLAEIPTTVTIEWQEGSAEVSVDEMASLPQSSIHTKEMLSTSLSTMMFTNPSDKRTGAYLTGEMG